MKRLRWGAEKPGATPRRRKVALLHKMADGWVLQHVRTITVSQRAASGCEIDTALVLGDLPGHVQARLPEDLQEASEWLTTTRAAETLADRFRTPLDRGEGRRV